MARSAIKSLSYSEILAMQHIFDELDGDEGLLVASRIADQAGITRSVIVNALRKLASANVIESRSLGMKGTYLRILNRHIRDELDRQRYPYLTGPAARVSRGGKKPAGRISLEARRALAFLLASPILSPRTGRLEVVAA